MAKFGEVAKTLPTTNGLIASQNNGNREYGDLSEHKGARHSLGSPGHMGYKLYAHRNQFISTSWSQRRAESEILPPDGLTRAQPTHGRGGS